MVWPRKHHVPILGEIAQVRFYLLDVHFQFILVRLEFRLEKLVNPSAKALDVFVEGVHDCVNDLSSLLRIRRLEGNPNPVCAGDDLDIELLAQISLRVSRTLDHGQLADGRLGDRPVKHWVGRNGGELGLKIARCCSSCITS